MKKLVLSALLNLGLLSNLAKGARLLLLKTA